MKVLLLLALIGAACAVPRNVQRVVGGEATTIDKYPYMANLHFAWYGVLWSQACGGSLITNNVVLSAAHCFYGDYASEWRAILGTSYTNSGGTTIYVRKLTLHPGFSPATNDNDVALMHLTNTVTFSNTINVARIPGPGYVLPDNTVLTVIGYGNLWYGGPSPSQLQHVEVNIINQDLCVERYAYLQTIGRNIPDVTENMLCAGILDVGGKDACQGDSGGPVAHDDDIIYGITSWGFECADRVYPGVNTRVSKFSNWIASNAV